MGLEDIHYSLSYDELKDGFKEFGIDFFNGGSGSFLKGIDVQRANSSGFSKSQMHRFSKAAELIQAIDQPSESMRSFVSWISHISIYFEGGKSNYCDIELPAGGSGSSLIYNEASVINEYKYIVKVRAEEIASLFSKHDVVSIGDEDLSRTKEFWSSEVERLKDQDIPNKEAIIIKHQLYADYHYASLESYRRVSYDLCYKKVYKDLIDVIRVWESSLMNGLGVFVTRF